MSIFRPGGWAVMVMALAGSAGGADLHAQTTMDYRPHQRAAENQHRVEAATQAAIERTRRETQEELAAQRAPVHRNADFAAVWHDSYAADNQASRLMGRAAPPPAGAESIRAAQQAWAEGRHGDAAVHLLRASQAGSAKATRVLGLMHEEGAGVPRNAANATELYLKAARMGDDAALLELGRTAALGIGAKPDLNQAIDWYTRASRRVSTREPGERGLALVKRLSEIDPSASLDATVRPAIGGKLE